MRKLAVLLFVIAATACGKKDVSLLNLLPAQSTVNPLTREIFSHPDARLYDVAYYGNGVIEGVSSINEFKTKQYFQRFSYAPFTLPNISFEQITKNGRNYLYIEQQMPNNVQIGYSYNFGKDWKYFAFIINGSTPSGYLSRYAYIDDTHIMLLMNYPNGNSYTSSVYRVNLETTQATLLSTVEDLIASTIHVRNNHVWITSSYGTIVHSADAGVNWSAPTVIQNGRAFDLTSGSENDLFAFCNDMALYSNDGGNSWNRTGAIKENFQWVDFADGKTVYALNNYEVQKSADGGNTWQTIQKTSLTLNVWGVPRFVNAQQGILWSAENVFLTEDGGETWHILLAKSYVQSF